MSSPSDRVGRYRLLKRLGQGGMGDVYEAMLEGPGGFEKRVALKVLRREATEDAASREALAREAKLGALLRHPNLVDVYEFGEADDQLFIAMELVEGPTVASLLEEQWLSPRQALEVARQACAGLAHAHELQVDGRPMGLVHRDLKPSNLLIDKSGLVKIADLGIARLAGSTTGRIEGTRGFMSPEQCEGIEIDGRSDIFSMGVVIFAMLTGQSPLRRGSPMATFLATSRVEQWLAEPDALAPMEAACRGLGEVVARCLRYKQDDRWQDARSLGKALRRLERVAPGSTLLDRVLGDELDSDTAMWVSAPSPDTVALSVSSPAVDLRPVPEAGDAFVGRAAAAAALSTALAGSRLVTLKGPAGVGKSRLAREVLRAREHVAWIDLSSADSALALLQRVGDALGHPLGDGDDDTLADQLTAFVLRQRDLVLLLDDADRVLEPLRAHLPDWTAKRVTVLVTSRESLGLPGEVVVDLSPLDPDEASALFVARAGRPLRPDEQGLLQELVEGLDGLPLAVELAAARAKVLPLGELLERMRDRFRLLRGNRAGGRKATMWGTLALSWDMLSEAERLALAQLSVFEGGFSPQAAEAVVDPSQVPDAPWSLELVEALLHRSLLWSRAVDEVPRFGMYDTIRDFARDQLDPLDAAPLRHALWCARYGEGPARDALYGPEGPERLAELARERANLEAACRWAVAAGEPELAAACYLAVADVLMVRGPARAALALAEEVLAMRGLRLARAEVLLSFGVALAEVGRRDDARQRLTEAVRVARRVEDPELEGQARSLRATLQQAGGRAEEAARDAHQAVALLEGGNPRHLGVALANRAALHRAQGRLPLAQADIGRALLLFQQAGDAIDTAIALGTVANLRRDEGDLGGAEDAYRQALALHRRVGNRRSEAVTLANLVGLLMAGRRYDEAREAAQAAVTVATGVGQREVLDVVRARLGRILVELGRTDEARKVLVEALQRAHATGDEVLEAEVLDAVGALHGRDGRVAEAAVAFEQAEHLHRKLGRVEAALRTAGARAKVEEEPPRAFRRLADQARAEGLVRLAAELLLDAAEAHLGRGERGEAEALVDAISGAVDPDGWLELRSRELRQQLSGSGGHRRP